ncbi:hypothetical protein [Chitinophaga niabensis]|nr:hypothetical protein [Chitinophaga niabensis]
MAISRSVILRGASGTFANEFVLRQRNGKTVMCKMPKPYPPKTANQLANQERFKKANNFAKAAIKDPAKKAYYKSIAKPGQSAFNAAFQDAYHKPEVEVSKQDQKIIVKTKGKHRIEKVKVGEHFAVFKNEQWEYENKQPGGLLKVLVYDVAGNICSMEIQT